MEAGAAGVFRSRSVQCLNGGHRNAVLLFYLGKLLCRAIQLAGTQRLGERHRRGIQVGKAQILGTRPSGCVLRGRLPSRSVPSGQLPDCGSCHPWETAAQTCGSLLRCTGDGILRCNLRPSVHSILDRHDMLIPFCPADCLFLFSIKIIS